MVLEVKISESIENMSDKILEQFDYNIKKCKTYIMKQYINTADYIAINQYWLEVGCNVERKFEVWQERS
jgi:hypothetical protein